MQSINKNTSVLSCVKHYFKKHLGIFLLTLLTVILVTALTLIPPQLLRLIVDDIIPCSNKSKLLIYAIGYGACYLLMGLIVALKETLLVIISQGVGKALRLSMIQKIHTMSYLNFSQYDVGTLEAYFSNDVDSINTLITSGVISMVIDSVKMIGILVSIFIFSYLFGLLTLCVVPLITLFTLWVKKRMFKAQKLNRHLEGEVNNSVLEALDNIKTIKSFRLYDSIEAKYNTILKGHFKTNQEANNYDALFSPVMNVLKYGLIVLVIVLSSLSTSSGTTLLGMTVGMVVSSIDLLSSLFSPIESLGMEIQTIQSSLASIKRINEFFLLPDDEAKDIDHVPNLDQGIILEFKDVTFSYEKPEAHHNVLDHFNLRLSNHDHLTLKGLSGSGKSTLFKLAYGLIKPQNGHVTINGADTYRLSDQAKRSCFGIVYQDYFFSQGTIKEELTLLNPNISDTDVFNALNLVGLTRIQDIHVPLILTDYSTGELSLFNIARAILLDSRILFLDEMNAKIDQVSAHNVINIINNVSHDKLVLSINHYGDFIDDSQILNLDKI